MSFSNSEVDLSQTFTSFLNFIANLSQGLVPAKKKENGEEELLSWERIDEAQYLLAKYTLVSLGDLQSKKYVPVEGNGNGGSASAIELLTQWTDYTVADKDWLGLSAGLGVELHNRLTLLEGQIAGWLSVDLTGYATQQWVNNQGFLKAVAWGDVSGKPSWIGATKPSYDFSEIGSKPTTLAGYGITDAYTKTEADGRFLGINATAKAAEKLATTSIYTAWGQTFFENGVPKSISGDMTNVGNITASGGTYKFLTYPTSLYGLVLSMNSSGCVLMQSQRAANDSEVFPIALNPTGGNVGIGTTSPAYKLDVNGVARVSQLKLGKFTFTDKGDYVEFDGTILALGDIQSKKYANIAGGGTGDGGDFSIMSSWNAELANDPDYVLSAGLGYNLHITKLDKIEAEGLYQPKGNYLTSHQSLADYVTVNTAQTISGLKTLGLKEGEPQNHEVNRLAITPYGHTGGPWYINSLDNTSTAYLRIKYGTSVPLSLSHMGDLTVAGKIIKSGGTSSQFLKADGSVDGNTYMTSLPARLSQYLTSALSDGNGFGRIDSGSPFVSFVGASSLDCMLITTAYSDAWRGELALDYRSNNIAYRNKNNGTWNDWAMMLSDKNYASILDDHYVKKSGDTMTGYLCIATNGKNVTIGCQNQSFVHYTTNAIFGHWFDKKVNVQGEIYAGENYNKKVLHEGNYNSYALPLSGGTMLNTDLVTNLNADKLDGYHADAFVDRMAYEGADNLSILKANYSALADSKAHTVRLQHGSHSMAFGWLLGGYAIENAYGGWFISDYGTPRWIGADNGTWKSETFAFISSTVASASKLATARNFAVADYDGSHTGEAVSFDGTAAATLKLPNAIKCNNLTATNSVTCSIARIGTTNDYGYWFFTPATASSNGTLRVGTTEQMVNANSLVMSVDKDTRAVNFHKQLRLNGNYLYLNNSKRLWVDGNGVLHFNGTILVDGDVQSKKASDPLSGNVVKTDLLHGPSYAIPTDASAVIMRTAIDGDLTLTLDGNAADFDIIYIYVHEYSPGDVTLKYGSTSYTVVTGAFALVNIGGTIYFLKLS